MFSLLLLTFSLLFLNFEQQGCNDGAAFPFLFLALFLTTNRDNRGKAMAEWVSDRAKIYIFRRA